MNTNMKPFCELMVQEVFPTVRALIAKELMDSYNYNQVEVAAKMGITQPAISQYMRELRGKRAQLIKGTSAVYLSIQNSAKKIATLESSNFLILCDVCKDIRASGLLCRLCNEAAPALEKCTICLKGVKCGSE